MIMEKVQKSPSQNEILDAWSKGRIAVFAQVTGITIATMGILGGLSYYVDHALGTFPVLFIIALILSFPLVQLLLWRKLRNFGDDLIKKASK